VSELRGRGWRVLGYFIWMLGAGLVLDSDATAAGAALFAIGAALLGVGAALFAIGAAQSSRRSTGGEAA
jgi:hypothetical protein